MVDSGKIIAEVGYLERLTGKMIRIEKMLLHGLI